MVSDAAVFHAVEKVNEETDDGPEDDTNDGPDVERVDEIKVDVDGKTGKDRDKGRLEGQRNFLDLEDVKREGVDDAWGQEDQSSPPWQIRNVDIHQA